MGCWNAKMGREDAALMSLRCVAGRVWPVIAAQGLASSSVWLSTHLLNRLSGPKAWRCRATLHTWLTPRRVGWLSQSKQFSREAFGIFSAFNAPVARNDLRQLWRRAEMCHRPAGRGGRDLGRPDCRPFEGPMPRSRAGARFSAGHAAWSRFAGHFASPYDEYRPMRFGADASASCF